MRVFNVKPQEVEADLTVMMVAETVKNRKIIKIKKERVRRHRQNFSILFPDF